MFSTPMENMYKTSKTIFCAGNMYAFGGQTASTLLDDTVETVGVNGWTLLSVKLIGGDYDFASVSTTL
jgi:hypothetical protein